LARRSGGECALSAAPILSRRVVFSFGANDSGATAIAPERSVRALATVLDEAAALGLSLFVAGPPSVGEAHRDDRVAALSASFAGIAAERKVPFVSLIESLRASQPWTCEAASADGTHPAAGGYEALARLVLVGGFVDWLRC